FLLREKSKAANWPVNVYPGELQLPDDLFEMVDGTDQMRESYLNPEFVALRSKTSGSGAKRTRTKPKRVAKPSKKSRGKQPQVDSDSDAMDEVSDN
ncbi:hypothetical protein GGH17_003047, partial [Coemansia sp. RSA 788]